VNENHDFSFFLDKRIISAVKSVESVIVMTFIILKGCWCDVIVLNFHAQTEDKANMKYNFYEELEHVFNKFSKYYMNILLSDFTAKVSRKVFSNKSLGMRVYMKLVMTMELRVENFATSKKSDYRRWH
jgi:hypothetical protein